ncbi:MAG TPA: hypothetical protein VF298_05270, partial [Bacteroidales bacterium]
MKKSTFINILVAIVFLANLSLTKQSIAQTGCTIIKENCPPTDLTPVCADTELNGVFGADVTWTPPVFKLDCSTTVPGEQYSFYVEFNLPEGQNTCWVYNRVQRIGSNNLNLWQSTGSGNPYFITPTQYIDNSTGTPINMELIVASGKNFNWTLKVLNGTTEVYTQTISGITTSGLQTITIPASVPNGEYNLKFEFSGDGNNACFVDRIYYNATLVNGVNCAGGVNFIVTTNQQPGDFEQVGVTPVTYTASYTNSSGTVITATCGFNVTVNGVTASATQTDAGCGLNNGTITLTATSSNSSPTLQYNLNNAGWVSFSSPATITGLAHGAYNINVRDYFSNLSGYCQILTPVLVNVGQNVDAITPAITCPATKNIDGCGITALTVANTGLVYSSTQQTISLAQFTAAGASVTDGCGVTSWKYQDTHSGTCPIIVTRTFSVSDASGNTATCSQIINVYHSTAPVVPACGANTVECLANAITPTTPSVVDACGATVSAVLVSTVDSPSPITCEGTRTYTYTYTDCAGLVTTWKYVYTIERNDFTMPVNAGSTIACVASAVVPTLPSVTDNCGNIITPVAPVISTAPACEGDMTYTYTYIDCEGNSHNWVYTYTIEREDFTMPVNGSSTVTCVSQITQPTTPIVNDNCGNTITPTGPVVTGNPVCQGTKTYTWTYTDCEGNTHEWSYVYTLNDNIAPNLIGTLPVGQTNINLCFANVPAGPTADDIKALYADNCDGAVIVTKSETPTGNNCAWSVTYNYEVKDACNNIVSPSPSITYSGNDNTNPSIVCPAVPLSLWPNSGPNYMNSGTGWDATATDNCSQPTLQYQLSGATLGSAASLNN